MRLILAIQCFFAVLFGGDLPPKALPPPPEPTEPEDKRQEREHLAAELTKAQEALSAAEKERDSATTAKSEALEQLAKLEGDHEGAQKELQAKLSAAEESGAKARARVEELEGELETSKGKLGQARDDGALALLAWLQREGRLIDFLREDIDDYDDDQVGAAVRAIHKGCRKVLDEALELEPILPGEEEAKVEVPEGFDPVAISLTGKVKGDPPFKGTLMHHGWRTSEVKIPVPEAVDTHVLAAAEVEL